VIDVPPLLRWVGGKRRLAPAIGPRLLSALASGGRYFEPFVGSAAIFLWLRAQGWRGRAVLSDACAPLIGMYQEVRGSPAMVADCLGKHAGSPNSEEVYLGLRQRFNTEIRGGGAQQAARFLWLNRRCFNGLWRTDARGLFNVAWGGPERKTAMPSGEELAAFAGALEGVDLRACDFGAVVYCDPPYNGTFAGYSSRFDAPEQGRLAAELRAAAGRGAFVVTSNADTEYVRALYGAWARIEYLELTYLVGGKKGRRPAAREVLITAGSRT
jgi:DNA adenine methylase